ncbi:hypothetical protein MPSEU_000320300 [Mayamaea pseudoterrestris]|nr:hypothetical protein MPSEU_000320300 [Mayamaea pseudoterrestris]
MECWGGLTCDIPRATCTVEHKCPLSGAPCDLQNDGKYLCTTDDCEYAKAMGDLAAKMCREPYTEYCPGSNESASSATGTELQFCTNGGKCQSTILTSRQVTSQSTDDYQTVTEQYQLQQSYEEGCVCANHFNGPHCEIMEWEDAMENDSESQTLPVTIAAVTGVLALLLGILMACRCVCQRRKGLRPLDAKELIYYDATGYLEEDESVFPQYQPDQYTDALGSHPQYDASFNKGSSGYGGASFKSYANDGAARASLQFSNEVPDARTRRALNASRRVEATCISSQFDAGLVMPSHASATDPCLLTDADYRDSTGRNADLNSEHSQTTSRWDLTHGDDSSSNNGLELS